MALTQPTSNAGISGKFVGVVAALLEHMIALFSLAALEVRQRIKETIICCLLLLAALFFITVGYLSLLVMTATLLVSHHYLNWPLVLGIIMLFHFLLAGLLLILLFKKQSSSFFPLTRRELHTDLQALSSMSEETFKTPF